MRRKNTNVLLVFGVVIAIILLMIWLFLGTTLEQEANPETDPMTVEQNYLIRSDIKRKAVFVNSFL